MFIFQIANYFLFIKILTASTNLFKLIFKILKIFLKKLIN